jgi:4-diphosphocytidyl-2-C-methyl-D-erythritol kinase
VAGGVNLGPEDENLVVLAARRYLREMGGAGGVRIELNKRIPVAAGLGGGSSDAAATLRAMNRLWGDPLDDGDLLQLGVELGSDVPFFLGGSTLALGWSRGERLLALPSPPSVSVLVAHPGEPMPTRGAFQRLGKLRGGEYRPRAFRLRLEDLSTWSGAAAIAENDFDAVAGEAIPRLLEAMDSLRAAGAIISLLAGSGASVFGIFPDSVGMDEADRQLSHAGFATWRCRTLEAFPVVRTLAPGTA